MTTQPKATALYYQPPEAATRLPLYPLPNPPSQAGEGRVGASVGVSGRRYKIRSYAAASASSSASGRGPESWPLAEGSRSTSSMIAIAALSP